MGQKFLMKLCSTQLLLPVFVIVSLLHLAYADLNSDQQSLQPFGAADSHGPELQGNPFLCQSPLQSCYWLSMGKVRVIAEVVGYAVFVYLTCHTLCSIGLFGDKNLNLFRDSRKIESLLSDSIFLGNGASGTTYKAKGSIELVIKRLKEVEVLNKEFQEKMEVIRRFKKHSNVVPLHAYYYATDDPFYNWKYVVYKYFEYGSLMTLLHGNNGGGRAPLLWGARVKIALGVAKGIAHIHAFGGREFFHGNIKSSNVLMNHKMDGVISDIGLVPLMRNQVYRSSGYQAPEVSKGGRHSQKSDVYSFGVLLLELLSAQHPLQYPRREPMVDLTRIKWEDWSNDHYDKELQNSPKYAQKDMSKMMILAQGCVRLPPDLRPTMELVVKVLEEIKLHVT